jgi:hypothetical protein
MKSVARLFLGLVLGAVLVFSAWFGGWVEPPEPLARRLAILAAVYPGSSAGAEAQRIDCAPLARLRLYVVCTGGCDDVWRIVLVKGLQTTVLANPGRVPPEDPGTRRRRINEAIAREALLFDGDGARAMAVCHMRLEGLEPKLVLPPGGIERVEAERAGGEEALRTYAWSLDEPNFERRIPIEATADGFEATMPYWDTFQPGHPVLFLRMRLAPDGRIRSLEGVRKARPEGGGTPP